MKTDRSVKFTVITVVRNGMPYVEQTLASVVSQRYPDFEYIVIDGKSSDGTINLIRKNAGKIAYWVSEPDNGISDAFNKGLLHATGDYIMFLNADDALVDENVLEIMASEINRYNLPQLIYGDCNVLDRESGKLIYRTNIDFKPVQFRKGRQMLPHPCMFAHRKYFEKYGNFSTQYKVAMDFEWLLRGVFEVSVVHVPVPVSDVRNGGVSANNRDLSVREIMSALKMHGYMEGFSAWLKIWSYFESRLLVKRTLQRLGLYRHLLNYRYSKNAIQRPN